MTKFIVTCIDAAKNQHVVTVENKPYVVGKRFSIYMAGIARKAEKMLADAGVTASCSKIDHV